MSLQPTELQSDDIRDAGGLAVAAYSKGNLLRVSQDASFNLGDIGNGLVGWRYIDPTQLGIDSVDVTNGYLLPFGSGLYALVAINDDTHTLAISFRGTDPGINFFQDALGGAVDFKLLYDGVFKSSINTILSHASDAGIDATRVLVTGHSLGGAMVEAAMADHAGDQSLVGVSFGSPGIQQSVISGNDSRLLNIGHVDSAYDGDPVFRATLHETNAGVDVRVNLPETPDSRLLDLIPTDSGTQHDAFLYKDTAHLIANELTKGQLLNFKFSIFDFTTVIRGTEPTSPEATGLFGTAAGKLIIEVAPFV